MVLGEYEFEGRSLIVVLKKTHSFRWLFRGWFRYLEDAMLGGKLPWERGFCVLYRSILTKLIREEIQEYFIRIAFQLITLYISNSIFYF